MELQLPDRRFQFRQALTNWLLSDTLPDSTRAKIQGTIQWFDSGSRGLLPPDHWFSNHDIQYVLDTEWDVALWTQLGTNGLLSIALLAHCNNMIISPGLIYNSTCSPTDSKVASPAPISPRGIAHPWSALSSRWRFSP